METTEDTHSGIAALACPDMTLDLARGDVGVTARLGAVIGVVHLGRGCLRDALGCDVRQQVMLVLCVCM